MALLFLTSPFSAVAGAFPVAAPFAATVGFPVATFLVAFFAGVADFADRADAALAAETFDAGAFSAGAFFAAVFFAAVFFAAVFFAAVFFAAVFFAAVFFAAVFFAAVFFAAVFFAAVFAGVAAFFAGVAAFVAGTFLAAVAVFDAVALAGAFFAGAFFAVAVFVVAVFVVALLAARAAPPTTFRARRIRRSPVLAMGVLPCPVLIVTNYAQK